MKNKKITGSGVFFTSDLHFNHENIIKFCNRPVNNTDEMHELIIKNWNDKVGATDTVYILGDVSWKGPSHTDYLLNQLNGKKILIIGNHDPEGIISLFDESYDMLGLNINDEEDGKRYQAHLCHFPMVSWYGMEKGSINIHGHLHTLTDVVQGKRIDVGLDGNNLTPWSWKEIKELMFETK